MTTLLVLWLAFADIGAVKSEPDLEKRSELALTNAERTFDDARQAYKDGDDKRLGAALSEIAESVDISYDALNHASAPPRRSKYYKRAELRVRTLIRRLSTFRDDVGYETRPEVEVVVRKLSDVHDQLISDIMSKNKR